MDIIQLMKINAMTIICITRDKYFIFFNFHSERKINSFLVQLLKNIIPVWWKCQVSHNFEAPPPFPPISPHRP